MIVAMPRPRPPHLHRETTRHGRAVWYVRVGHGPRVRINAEFGTPEFTQAYNAAIHGEVPPAAQADPRTLRWLVEQYRQSGAWRKLAPATRRQRENVFLHILKSAGSNSFAAIQRKHVIQGLDARADRPSAAKHFLQTMRGLFIWAKSCDHVEKDPTEGVKAERLATEGFEVWTEDEIARFEAHWPIGTRERLALAVFLYTGLRRGDAARLGRQHVSDGVISLKTEKTGTPVIIPMLPDLRAVIDASPTGDMVFIAGKSGKPMTKESLGNWFRESCSTAGIGKSAHGLRKAAATRLANAGATVAQLEAVFGWQGGNMASLYTRAADRAKLARDIIEGMAAPQKADAYSRTGPKVRELRPKTLGEN